MPRRKRDVQKIYLEHSKDDHLLVMQIVAQAKRLRKFQQIARDGILLVWSLTHNDDSVLRDKFPAMVEKIEQKAIANAGSNNDDLHQMLQQIQAQLSQTSARSGIGFSHDASAGPGGYAPNAGAVGGSVSSPVMMHKPLVVVQNAQDDDESAKQVIMQNKSTFGLGLG